MIEQSAFVEVGIVGIGSDREQQSRQLQHVVDVARLRGPPVDTAAQLAGRSEVFVGTVSARRESVVLHDAIPEEGCSQYVFRCPNVRVPIRRTDELGHLRVAVRPSQVVLMAHERLDERLVLELVRQFQPALVTGVGVEIHHDLVHAAELGVEHPLDLLVIERREDPLGPFGKLGLQFQRRAVAGKSIGVT